MVNYYYLSILVLAFLFSACNSNPQEIVQENQPFFHTTDPSRLYFQNTRGHKYKSITQQDSRIDYYYLKAIDQEQLINPIIANNWLAEEAYILLENSDPLDAKNYTIALVKEDQSDTLQITLQQRTDNYDFCKMLYTKSKSGYTIDVLTKQGQWHPIFENEKARGYFYEVMRDYLRLTEQI
ncbi:MAG: hypothetical protein AAFO82_05245 [Bacteroidota bacterium]